jgi:very-short-patch-repair endonuclease
MTPEPEIDTRRAPADVCHTDAIRGPQIDTGPEIAAVCRSTAATEPEVARLASAQKGLIRRRQLRAIGISDNSIRRRLADGRLHRVFRGVYLVGHTAMPPLARELAAVLAYEPHAVLSHRAAVGVWRFLPTLARLLDVTVSGRNPGRQDGIVVHRARSLDPRDVARVNGVPITSAARTLLDFAETADRRDLERAFGEAQARGLITGRSIGQLLDRSPGRRGAPVLRDLLAQALGPRRSHSELEELMLALIREARLPQPDMNVLVLGRYKVDFVWPEERTIAEVDGGGWHASKQRLDRDHRRDSDLRAAGFKVERFTDRELTHEPKAVVSRLTRALYAT